jgi:hypothetical protein
VIVVDYTMRAALADQSLGLTINSHIKSRAKYTTALDFADNTMLVADDAINSQKQLDPVDFIARGVGLTTILERISRRSISKQLHNAY